MWLTTPDTIEHILVERPLEPVSDEALDQSVRAWRLRGVRLAPSEVLRKMPVVSIGQPETWTLQDFYSPSRLPRPIQTKLSQADFYLVRLSCSFPPCSRGEPRRVGSLPRRTASTSIHGSTTDGF